jgi:uncharacterized membrane protein
VEDIFKSIASYIALGVEAGAVLLILIGASEALFKMLGRFFSGKFVQGTRKEIWARFGVWLLLGLEFELAADIIRSAISPSWTDIGQLAAIASIRTLLNYFLEKDIENYGEAETRMAESRPSMRAA